MGKKDQEQRSAFFHEIAYNNPHHGGVNPLDKATMPDAKHHPREDKGKPGKGCDLFQTVKNKASK